MMCEMKSSRPVDSSTYLGFVTTLSGSEVLAPQRHVRGMSTHPTDISGSLTYKFSHNLWTFSKS